jgi:hypothetical protein
MPETGKTETKSAPRAALTSQLQTILTEMSKASAIERARIAKLSLLCSAMGYMGDAP